MLDAFTNYLRWERRRSEATVTAYEADVAQWLLYLEHAMGMPDASSARRLHVRSWVSDLVQNAINLLEVPANYDYVVSGLVIAAAASLDVYRRGLVDAGLKRSSIVQKVESPEEK